MTHFELCFDRRVTKISTPTNFDCVVLIFLFSNWYCHSVYIFSSIWRHNGVLPDQLWSDTRSRSSKYLTLASETTLSEKNFSHEGWEKSLFWASATRLIFCVSDNVWWSPHSRVCVYVSLISHFLWWMGINCKTATLTGVKGCRVLLNT